MKTQELEIKNIGPIQALKLNVVPGGITVLKGPNGSGKSTVLDTVQKLQTENKNIRLTSRDGTTGGQADGFGVRVKISRAGANKMAGECEVPSIEGDLNISDFVDPKLKSDAAADEKRIRSLVVLTGATAEESLFHDLFQGGKEEFLKYVSQESRECDSLLEMASKIKRDIESHARGFEERAKTASSEAQALKDLVEGIDTDAESDDESLENAANAARDTLSALKERRDWFTQNKESYDKAKESLSSATENVEDLKADRKITEAQITELKAKLEQAVKDLAVMDQKIESAEKAEKQRAALQELVNSYESREEPTAEQIEAAEKALEEAKAARDKGVEIRKAKEKLSKIDEYLEAKKAAERKADDLRTAARGTQDVLAEVVKASCPELKVDEQFRLVIEHPKRGECYFSELSEGERWKVGIEIALAVFKKKGISGLLGIPQDAWEGLDVTNRKIILNAIKGTDLAIITAEATRSESENQELHAELIEG